jgi:hypothetical protein
VVAINKQEIEFFKAGISKQVGNALEAIASIAALFPAAYISYSHMREFLLYPHEPALLIAGAVELLGYMIVNAAIRAMERGRRWLMVLGLSAFGGYLLVIVSVNLILGIANAFGPDILKWARIFAGADLALLSVPAAILAAIQSQLRSQDVKETLAKVDADSRHVLDQADKAAAEARAYDHEEKMLKLKLDAEAAEKDKKRLERSQKVSVAHQKVSNPAVKFPKDYRHLTHDQKVMLSKMTAQEISVVVGNTVKSGENWLKAFGKEGIK